jgi:hypothetical protein
MKRLAFLIAILLVVSVAAFSADVETLSVSGSVGMEFGDDDTTDNVGPGFFASKSGTFANIAVGTSNDKVEAGVTVSLVPAISWTLAEQDPGYPQASNNNNTGFDLISKMVTWYWNEMSGKEYTDDAGATQTYEAIDFNALEDAVEATTGLDFIIFGNPTDGWTVEDDEDELTSDARREHAFQVYEAVLDALDAAIDNTSSKYSGDVSFGVTYYPDDIDYTAEELAAAEAEQDLYDSFEEYIFGAPVDAQDDTTFSASTPLVSAYLRLNAIGGILDVEFEVMGKAVGVGSMVTSDKSSGDANYGLTLALDEAVVPGLVASVLVTTSEGEASTSDDPITFTDETDAGENRYVGSQLNVGYTFSNDMMNAGALVKFGIIDFSAVGESLVIGIEPSFGMPGVAGLNVGAEFNLLVLGSGTTGIGLGATVGASIMGISPSLSFYMKTADYYGDDSLDFFDGDNVDDSSMMAEFNSTDLAKASALAGDVSVDLAEVMGLKLLTLGVGADFFFGDGYSNFGMDGSLGLDFSEVLGAPLTLGFNMGRYGSADMNDLTWGVNLGYTYAELFMVKGYFKQTEAETFAYGVGGSVSF